MKFVDQSVGLLLGAVLSGNAATFTVGTTADAGEHSLRSAILAANASPGTDLITFAIPGAGPHRISPETVLPTIVDPVVIDGTTQPGFNGTPLVEVAGNLLPESATGFLIVSGQSTVRGLVLTRFGYAGICLKTKGTNVVEGNFIGTDLSSTNVLGNGNGIVIQYSAGNRIGGTTVAARNLISGNTNHGLWLLSAMQNYVIGNYIGTDVAGSLSVSNLLNGILLDIGSQYNVIAGGDLGGPNLISGNGGAGVLLRGEGTTDNFVQGNLIGVDAAGRSAVPNAAGVALLDGAFANTIGGPSPGEGNLISGNWGPAIRISGADTTDNLLHGNFLGTDWTGNAGIPNWGPGVWIADSAQYNQAGGAESGQGNRIAFNLGGGVLIQDPGTTGNSVFGNAIFSNHGLGIDLLQPSESSGTVTPNDTLDRDTGPNQLQNYPVITNLAYTAGSVLVEGFLCSQSNRSYVLDFYLNAAPEPSGYGEGQVYLGYAEVTTDAAGSAQFAFVAGGGYSNQYVTATATDLASNDTSEFSAGFGGFIILGSSCVGPDFKIVFANTRGQYYRLERSQCVPATNWTAVPDATRVAGTGTALTVTDPGGALGPSMFYRLTIVP